MEYTERVCITNRYLENIRIIDGALHKAGGEAGKYDAKASSADCITDADSQRRGISCTIPPEGPFQTFWMVGLAPQLSAADLQYAYRCLKYGACVSRSRMLEVYEKGRCCGEFGRIRNGDIIKVILNADNPPHIEYHINGELQYTSRTPVAFPLFPMLCACYPGKLAKDLSWILRDPPALPVGIDDLVAQVTELQARVSELETQLRVCEQDLRTATEAKQAEIDVLLAANAQQKEEMKAESDVMSVVNAQLLAQLEAANQAEKSVPCMDADEKQELEIRAMRLGRQNQEFRKAVDELADENAKLQVEKRQMHAVIQNLQRQLLQSDPGSGEVSCSLDVGSSTAVSSVPDSVAWLHGCAKQCDTPTECHGGQEIRCT